MKQCLMTKAIKSKNLLTIYEFSRGWEEKPFLQPPRAVLFFFALFSAQEFDFMAKKKLATTTTGEAPDNNKNFHPINF